MSLVEEVENEGKLVSEGGLASLLCPLQMSAVFQHAGPRLLQ